MKGNEASYIVTPEVASTLVLTRSAQRTNEVRQIVERIPGTEMKIVRQGADRVSACEAGDLFAQNTREINQRTSKRGDKPHLDPEAARRRAEENVRNGGALIRLTASSNGRPATLSPVFDKLYPSKR